MREAIPDADVSIQRRQLATLALAMVLSMSTWFSTAAVSGQLRADWNLSQVSASWLTIVVQLGFVAGAVASSLTNLADRVRPRRLILCGAAGAAAANALVPALDAFGSALVLRFLTGACLALVYPPAMKAMSGWFDRGRGLALGVMVGALSLGSSLSHLINALGGLDWKWTLVVASVATVVGGVVADLGTREGPFARPSQPFDPRLIRRTLANSKFRLASLGYFGHMWELYAMWSWIAAFYLDAFGDADPRWASFAAFGVVGMGAAGSVYAGLVSDRKSRTQAAAQALRWSGALAIFTGFLLDAPTPVVVVAGLIWGFWVVADSAQFSTIVTEVSDQDYVGTALTLQLAAGFVLTVFTIFLVPVVRDAFGWGWAFLLLAPGPLVGVFAMRALDRAES